MWEKTSLSDLPKIQKRSNYFNKTHGFYIFAILLASLCFPFSIAYGADGQDTQNKKEISNDIDSWNLFSSLGQDKTSAEVISLPDTVLRRRGVKVDSGLLEKAAQGQINYISFNLFDDTELGGVVDRTIIRSASSYSIIGHIDEESSGFFILTVNEDVVVGNIRTSDRKHYQVMYSKADVHEIRQIDDSQFPACGLGPQHSVRAPETAVAIPEYSADIAAYDNGDTFDVMVVYTPAARSAAGGTTAIRALIYLAIDQSNIIYANSEINSRLRLVHRAEVFYIKRSPGAFYNALDDVTGKSDGYMDNVHTLRDTYGADFVALLINDYELCGLGWLMTALSHEFEDRAFSISAWSCIAAGTYVLPHELGHNMGLHHAVGDGDPPTAQGDGLYNYSHGWRWGPYRSVMAYAPGTRTTRISNPDVYHSGYPTGSPLGEPDEAHNALSVNNAALTMANWRQTVSGATPVAEDDAVFTLIDTPVMITLVATDDGMPDPPGDLSYIITSSPGNGTLTDPAAGVISTFPYTLLNKGNELTYTPENNWQGSGSFQFKANDGGTAPDGGDSNIATISINVFHMIHLADMDTDPGWSLDPGSGNSKWEWGTPAGEGGEYGNPDPISGHTGSTTNVMGYNLLGDYRNSIPATEWATTQAIDCSAYTNINLTFYRWLNIEEPAYDHAYIEVSNNGSNWTFIWENTDEITDSDWSQQQFDISAVADNQPTVFVRWGMGTTDISRPYSGWNIDDVMLAGIYLPRSDINGDGKVNGEDFAILASRWVETGCESPDFCGGADINADGDVGMPDLLKIALDWTLNY